jgi:dCMP deaminase
MYLTHKQIKKAKHVLSSLITYVPEDIYNNIIENFTPLIDFAEYENPTVRPSRDEYFMGFARQAAKMATCDRGKSGAAIVVDGQVVSTGYVGAASKLDHCDDSGHLIREVVYIDEIIDKNNFNGNPILSLLDSQDLNYHPIRQHCMRTAHAEGNAIVYAAKHGIAINGGTLYCKMEPCLRCCVDIINAGIKRVVSEYRYHGARLTREWFKKAGVELVVLNDELPNYSKV